ncbi:MAG TPA: ABC transporter ATP-binding protein [Candidatus Binatia bacterium]|nr:ABC transporter ATP-binding protein [Candidatus Binatia bacterium]
MLACEGLHVGYGRVDVLHGVSLAVQPDELVALIGPNGAGKTTALKTIVGLLRPTRGSVTFDGASLVGSDPADIVGRGIALVPQGRMVFQTLTVRENLRLGAYRAESGEVGSRVEAVLAAFPALSERLGQLGGTLSGGQQQMLAIARALMSNPALLILDEPSTGLAPTIVESIFQTLNDLHRRGTMILLVEQNAHIALELASRAYVLEQGSIVAEGPAAALRQDARVMAAYLG